MSKMLGEVRWPFLVLLAALLVLSLVAPRAWWSDSANEARPRGTGVPAAGGAQPPQFDTLATQWWASVLEARIAASAVTVDAVEEPARRRGVDVSMQVAAHVQVASATREDQPAAAAENRPVQANAAAVFPSAIHESPPQPAVTGLRDDSGDTVDEPTLAKEEVAAPADEEAPEIAAADVDGNDAFPAIRPASEPLAADVGGVAKGNVPHPVPIDEAREAAHGATAWPMPVRTIERLRELARHDATRTWAGEMLCVFDDLRRGVALSPAEFDATLGHLERLLASGEALEMQLIADPAIGSQITRTRFAVERRMDAWRAVYALHQVAGGDRLASRDGGADLAARDPASVLRILPSSQAMLADEAVALLDDIETYEESPSPHAARKIALAARQLSRHDNAAARQLGEHVDLNYRNANVRVAAHGDLLNRFLPQPSETAGDVDDFVAGVPVHGTQRTRTRLLLRLLPDDRRIRLGLEAHGEVDSDTAATSGPATVFTTGETRFLARKLVLFDEQRWRLFPAVAAARNESSLSGMRTDFDPFPILNSIVHSVVRSKHEERRWSAQREVEDRISQQAQTQLDAEADPKFSQLTAKATQTLVEPLERLGLEPTPIALATTDERVIFRYRLAGGEQLGGHTPRPRAPADSMLSVQVHESSINNALANLDLAGKTFELRSLYESVSARLGRPDIKVPDDVPEGVQVTFAAENPLQVRLADNAAEITLRIDRLEAERQTWRDLTVIARYEPEVNGLDALFARNVAIRLSGKNLNTRSNIVLRGVFSKMFTRNKQVHLLPEAALADARLADLAVNQLVVHDGWVGLAIGPRRAGGVAQDAMVDSESASRDGAPGAGVRR